MIFKILLPITVIAIVYFLGRFHARKDQPTAIESQETNKLPLPKSNTFQLVAYALVVSVASLAGWYVYQDWQESKLMVRIRVINAKSGKVTLYDAPKGMVFGRAFTTADGRRVTLADVERMEVQPLD
ncbi:MAG: hypothetical protein HQL71_11965 [Magnetococcales bacterium]|nr:hypothetical protein [Magnetococcales bacterium]